MDAAAAPCVAVWPSLLSRGVPRLRPPLICHTPAGTGLESILVAQFHDAVAVDPQPVGNQAAL